MTRAPGLLTKTLLFFPSFLGFRFIGRGAALTLSAAPLCAHTRPRSRRNARTSFVASFDWRCPIAPCTIGLQDNLVPIRRVAPLDLCLRRRSDVMLGYLARSLLMVGHLALDADGKIYDLAALRRDL